MTLNVAVPALDDRAGLNQRRTVMTANAINAKSEALKLHELSSEELDAVSGGNKVKVKINIKEAENRKQADALKGFKEALQSL
jgi:hypothetical protein